MKVKQTPADFIVREISRPDFVKDGAHAIYQLAKSGIGTIEALNIIKQSWNINRNFLSAGGLKDRHAQTEQLISIYQGPHRNLQNNLFELKYLGQSKEPIKPNSFDANRFSICLRDLSKSDADKIQQRFKEIAVYGFTNYFDEQRFGSVRGGNKFAAQQLIHRDYEGALKIALTSTSSEDRRSIREIRQTIGNNWGDWHKCFELLPRSSERSIINYLRDHPVKFRQAFELIDPNLVLLYLHSYQSYLWNKGVSRLLMRYLDNKGLIHVPYLLGEFIFYQSISEDTLALLKELNVPFITHKTTFPSNETGIIFKEILQEEGIEQNDFRIRGMQKTYFRKGGRRLIIFPQNHSIKNTGRDDLNKGHRLKLTLEFELPRGAYATILIKRLSYDFK